MTKQYETCVVANDFHIPFQDDRLIRLWFKFLDDIKPDVIIINGDLLDCWELSKYDKNPREGSKFKDEIVQGEEFFAELRSKHPKAHIVYVFGNHEFRLQSYIIRNAQSLAWFDEFSIEGLMHLDKYDIEIANTGLKESYYKYGDLYVSHFNKVSKHAGYTAKALVDDKMVSVMQAHVHRFGLTIRRTFDDRYLGGYENGCMCTLNPSYLLKPNWCHGFSVVYKEKNDNRFQVVQVPIIKYRFFFGNKEYFG